MMEFSKIMPCTQAEDMELTVFRQKHNLHKAKWDLSQRLPAKLSYDKPWHKKREKKKGEKKVYSKEGTTASGHLKEDIFYWRADGMAGLRK